MLKVLFLLLLLYFSVVFFQLFKFFYLNCVPIFCVFTVRFDDDITRVID